VVQGGRESWLLLKKLVSSGARMRRPRGRSKVGGPKESARVSRVGEVKIENPAAVGGELGKEGLKHQVHQGKAVKKRNLRGCE